MVFWDPVIVTAPIQIEKSSRRVQLIQAEAGAVSHGHESPPGWMHSPGRWGTEHGKLEQKADAMPRVATS